MGEGMRHYDGPPRTQQEVKRLNEALLDAFYALGLSRYTSGRVEWAQTQGKMRANRAAHEQYAAAHYPVWTHPEMLRHLWAARKAYIDNPCEPTLDTLCHVNYNLWHTDFLETYEHAKAGILDLSDPFSGLRKVAESARGTLTTWQEIKDRNPTATVGRWVNGANVSVGVDEMIEDAMADVEIAEGQLAEALGEPTVAAVRDLRREEPLPAPVAPPPKPARAPAHAASPATAPAAWAATHQAKWKREDKLVEALATYQGGWTKRKRPRLQELREHARMPDITRAERNRIWDALKAKEGQR